MPSASLSLGTGCAEQRGGAKVGYFVAVSRCQEAISIGEALVKSVRVSKCCE